MIFDGKRFAACRLEALAQERAAFGALSLGIIMASADPVTSSYVRIKEKNAALLNITLVCYSVEAAATTEAAVALVQKAERENDGVIVQLPLPKRLESTAII